jgi:threonine dehydrogenase-like Zn-dependent dehydrogenase
MGDTVQTDVLIVGAGPSGYVAINSFFFLLSETLNNGMD